MASRSSRSRSADAGQETTDRIRELNDRIVENARKAGDTYLDAYESMLNMIVSYQEGMAEAAPMDWMQQVIESQAKFTRDIGNMYASAAREALRR